MCALLAASYPLPPAARSAFLEHCAREIANLPELGDGVLHRGGRRSQPSPVQRREHPPIMQILGLIQHHGLGPQSFVFGGHASSPFFFLITGDFVV